MKKLIFSYLRKRLAEKTTKAAIVGMVATAVDAGAGSELLAPIEALVGGLLMLGVALLPSPKVGGDTVNLPMAAFVAAGLLLTLTACGANGSVLNGWLVDISNPQSKAGTNETLLKWKTVQTEEGSFENQLNYLYLLNAQESGELTLELALSDGTLYKFNGSDIKAFGAFETRAQAEAAIANVLGDLATPENVASLAKLLGGGTVP